MVRRFLRVAYSTPASEVTISRAELVIPLVENYMCATGTPSWTLTVKNHRASVHALCRDSQQSSALRGRGPRRSRVAVRGLEPPRPLSLRVVAYPPYSSTKVTADAAAPI